MVMNFRPIVQFGNLFGKTVLVRVDFNVPMKGKNILDNYKIKKSLPTIKFLVEKGAKVVLVSHLGRPAGKGNNLSLKPASVELGKFLQKNIPLLNVLDLPKAKIKIAKLLPGAVVMLENIRFVKGETENDDNLSKDLASLADIFVLDGFAVAHRSASSVSGGQIFASLCWLVVARRN